MRRACPASSLKTSGGYFSRQDSMVCVQYCLCVSCNVCLGHAACVLADLNDGIAVRIDGLVQAIGIVIAATDHEAMLVAALIRRFDVKIRHQFGNP